MRSLQSKNVLVTGATSGIGQAIAVRLATAGANVAINYRSAPESAEPTEAASAQMCSQIRGCGGKDFPVQGDVSQEEDVVAMCAKVVEKFGRLDILINNAGIQMAAASHQVKTPDFDKVIDVNLRGAYLCAREAIKHFLNSGNGGVIINVSSVDEMIPRPQYISYSISKGGMANMTRTLPAFLTKSAPREAVPLASPTLEALPHLGLTLAYTSARKRQCVVKIQQEIVIN